MKKVARKAVIDLLHAAGIRDHELADNIVRACYEFQQAQLGRAEARAQEARALHRSFAAAAEVQIITAQKHLEDAYRRIAELERAEMELAALEAAMEEARRDSTE